MRGCGTVFKSASLTGLERETLEQLEQLAQRLEWQAVQIRYAIAYCDRNQTLKGLSEMVAYSFNSQQHTPQYGGGGGGLPAGPQGEDVDYKVVIINSEQVPVKDSFQQIVGGYLAFDLACIEGPQKDVKHTDRLNLHHVKPQVVEIANKQLSAYCHVTGRFQFNDTAELHGIPFIVRVGLQKGDEARAKGYTEVKALFDINGNEPGKAGAGPQVQQQQPQAPMQPAGGVQPSGQGWGGQPGIDSNVPVPGAEQPQGQPGGGWGQSQGQPAQQPPQGGAPAGWGQPAQQQQPAQQPQQQWGGQQQQPPGWGAPA